MMDAETTRRVENGRNYLADFMPVNCLLIRGLWRLAVLTSEIGGDRLVFRRGQGNDFSANAASHVNIVRPTVKETFIVWTVLKAHPRFRRVLYQLFIPLVHGKILLNNVIANSASHPCPHIKVMTAIRPLCLPKTPKAAKSLEFWDSPQ
jgi:hypothetical protein